MGGMVSRHGDTMSNPFDAAIPAMIECFEANEAFYLSGKDKPNYPMPAKLDIPVSLISWLWVHMPRTKRNRKALNQWYLSLCFDKRGHYKS